MRKKSKQQRENVVFLSRSPEVHRNKPFLRLKAHQTHLSDIWPVKARWLSGGRIAV
jgi:hypothetical protein